jgi:hypothetical protein
MIAQVMNIVMKPAATMNAWRLGSTCTNTLCVNWPLSELQQSGYASLTVDRIFDRRILQEAKLTASWVWPANHLHPLRGWAPCLPSPSALLVAWLFSSSPIFCPLRGLIRLSRVKRRDYSEHHENSKSGCWGSRQSQHEPRERAWQNQRGMKTLLS